MYKYYKSDFALLVTFGATYTSSSGADSAVSTAVPFKLKFWTPLGGDQENCYEASSNGGTIKNCSILDSSRVIVYFDRTQHEFAPGELMLEAEWIINDAHYEGDTKNNVKRFYNTGLILTDKPDLDTDGVMTISVYEMTVADDVKALARQHVDEIVGNVSAALLAAQQAAASATSAASSASSAASYSQSIATSLASVAGSDDPGAALSAQVATNTADIAQLGLKVGDFSLYKHKGRLLTEGVWNNDSNNHYHWAIPVNGGDNIVLTSSSWILHYDLFATYTPNDTTGIATHTAATGYGERYNFAAGETKTISSIPADARWLYVYAGTTDEEQTPADIRINGVSVFDDLRSAIESCGKKSDENEKRIESIELVTSTLDKIISASWSYGYVKTDGDVVTATSGSYLVTTIDVESGDIYEIVHGGSASTLGIASYDADGNLGNIKVSGNGKMQTSTISIPDGIETIKITKNTSYSGTYYIKKKGSLSQVDEKVEEISNIVKVNSYSEKILAYPNISPKKAAIIFEMDTNASIAFNDKLFEYVNLLKQYGVYASTYFPMRTMLSSYSGMMDQLKEMGNEIALHTVPDDGFGDTNTTHATVANAPSLIVNDLNAFASYGYYVHGWVTSQGLIVPELKPIMEKYMSYAHTKANKNAYTNASAYQSVVNTRSTDRYAIVRLGFEKTAADGENQSDIDATMVQTAKNAIDAAIASDGLLVFYSHSYKNASASYTLREEVLVPILQYLKQKIDTYQIVTGTAEKVINWYYK